MNNIYKVIWSKAKNCYVVASEIARSHTKSATGSEKIGGVTRRSLLASLMALSLLCGGLGVASASLEVLDQSGTAGTVTIYTKDEVDNALTAKGTAADVASNKEAITNLKNAVGDAGSGLTKEVADQKAAIAANTASITTNKDNITQLDTKKLDKDLANSTFATKDALNGLAATVNNKVDESVVETALDGKADKADTLAGYGIKDAYTKGDVDNKLNEKADAANVNTALAGKANVGDSYTKAEADGKFATSEALNTAKTDLEGKITSAKNELDGKITANTQKIGANETAITDLKDADVRLEGKINQNTNDITGLKDKDVELSGKIDNNKNLIDQNAANITQNKNDIAAIGGRLTTAEGNIQTNADAINALDTKVGTINNGNYLDGTKSVGENLNALDAQTKTNTDEIARVNQELVNTNNHFNTELGKTNTALNKEVQERVDADTKLTGRIDATDKRTAGIKRTDTGVEEDNQTVIEGKVHFDQNGNVSDVKDLSAETITTTGDAAIGGALGVTGATTLDGALMANGEATFKDKVSVEKDLTVNGKLNVGEIYLKNDKLESTGKKHDSATSITADGISNLAKVTEHGNTTESQFTHNEKGSFNYAKDGNTTDWKESTSNVTADGVKTEAKDSKGNRTNTSQTAEGIKGYATDKDGYKTYTKVTAKENSFQVQDKDGKNKNHQVNTLDKSVTEITNADGKTTKTEQTALDITNTAKDGTITNDAKNIVNNASGNMTNTVGGDLKTTVSGNELHEVTGKQTNKIDGDQENTIGGNQTTTVTGDISNKAENITNEANTKLTDKVGENTRVLDSEGITDTVGGSTFKQRIDKIMMESKDVSIKAEETLTNEAKVITNKASEVINNEAVNINNTATGIITSKASEIKNQADKLISNKVGENTWENMENGKITTSIKDGAKQNLTQSDAAGTTQSTVDGGKSTVTIQNADGLADAVTDGTNTSVQNQTASAIAAAVKDGAGNENASVANATTSVNTIKSGSKANTVISTADGTSFINSEAAAPVGDGTEVKTTIKGNTITTGKVTMDYAEVMKDLGVRGNANITGKTTTGSLEVTGTSTLKGDVTMGSNATVKKDLTVEGNTNLKNTKVDGTLDVTQKATFGDSVSIAKDLSVDGNATIKGDVTAKSYKVGDKTYISAAGINANDQKITNVADGSISEGSKDAVNGGQLYGVKNDLEGKVNKVGANAAAMANLHPMEFDPDSKWNIAAAIGNYGSETAAALGAFYRPNDDVMVNLSTAFGTGENMVGGGVSVRLGKSGNKLSREESNALKDQVNDLTARMDALLSVLNPNMSKDFPDVPENHWAYEAVSRLAGNDIVQGYPDGEFHGERTMTRYEMAEIIYNALSRGAEAERELVEEFKPELQAMAASEKATAERAEG